MKARIEAGLPPVGADTDTDHTDQKDQTESQILSLPFGVSIPSYLHGFIHGILGKQICYCRPKLVTNTVHRLNGSWEILQNEFLANNDLLKLDIY
jgi:hypothetical protein